MVVPAGSRSPFLIFPPNAVEQPWRVDALSEPRLSALPVLPPSCLQLALPIPADPLHVENGASLLFRPEAVLPAGPGAHAHVLQPRCQVWVSPGMGGTLSGGTQGQLLQVGPFLSGHKLILRVPILIFCEQGMGCPSESSAWPMHQGSPSCSATEPGWPTRS